MTAQIGAQDPDNGKDEDEEYNQTLHELYFSKLQQMLEYANRGEPNGGRPRCVRFTQCRFLIGAYEECPVVSFRLLPISHYNW